MGLPIINLTCFDQTEDINRFRKKFNPVIRTHNRTFRPSFVSIRRLSGFSLHPTVHNSEIRFSDRFQSRGQQNYIPVNT